jgi:hypothetical protein
MLTVGIICFLIAFVANLAYWNGCRCEVLIYFPRSGWGRALNIIGSGIAALVSALWLLRVLPLGVAGTICLTWIAGIQVYSIWFRWRKRRVAEPEGKV